MAHKDKVDRVDEKILEILQADGRRPYAEIGAEVGISGPSAHERVKKLEARGVIRGYGAMVDPDAVGYDVLAFAWVTQAPGTVATDLTGDFATIPELEECHHIAGEADYLLKIRARDTRDLERVIHLVQATRHVFSTETDVVFSSAFERRPLRLVRETGGGEAT
jgi:Lrp/AsnC family leucine-responsive transcriptional regulator